KTTHPHHLNLGARSQLPPPPSTSTSTRLCPKPIRGGLAHVPSPSFRRSAQPISSGSATRPHPILPPTLYLPSPTSPTLLISHSATSYPLRPACSASTLPQSMPIHTPCSSAMPPQTRSMSEPMSTSGNPGSRSHSTLTLLTRAPPPPRPSSAPD
ncbi:hypothetical protein BD779DRAFT_1515966, partial [Infundibulicybe gibba]